MKRLGYLDSRRLRQKGVPNWEDVPLYGIPGSMASYSIFEEFMGIGANVAASGVVPLGSGTWWCTEAADITVSQADVAGGVMTLTCGGVGEDGGQMSLGGKAASGGAFFLAAGKTLWFEVRAKFTDLGTDKLNAFFGLVNPTATEWLADAGAAIAVDDILGWVIRDTETNWSFVGDKASVEDMNDCGAGCDTTDLAYHYFGFRVNGVTSVYAYWDRVQIAAAELATANIPAVGLMPGFAIKAGSGAAEVLTIDYLQCVELR